MIFLADIRAAFGSLAAAKSRTALTMLGVVIGILSVFTVSSVGESAQRLIVSQVSSLGTNLIAVIPGASPENGPPPIAFGIVTTTLTRADAEALARIPHVQAVTSYVRASQPVTYRGDSAGTSVTGTDASYPEVEGAEVAEGRFFTEAEVRSFSRVAVLGAGVAEKLGRDEVSMIGKDVRIKNTSYSVVGVLKERGSVFFQDQDDLVIVPVTTAQKLVAGVSHVDFVRLKVDNASNNEKVKEDIRRTLRRRHNISDPGKDDFSVRSTDQAAAILSGVTGALKWFLLAITAISLLVGGVNIMNIMFVAVRERTREIGLRKALGARRGRILFQFLVESAAISFIGGVVGLALAFGVAYGTPGSSSCPFRRWPARSALRSASASSSGPIRPWPPRVSRRSRRSATNDPRPHDLPRHRPPRVLEPAP